MPALDGLSGIILGAIFGSVLILTCIISAIKAVKDRSRIQKQRAMRRKINLEELKGKEKVFCSEENQPNSSSHIQPESLVNLSDEHSNHTSALKNIKHYVDCSDTGVNNLTFKQRNSHTDIDENRHLSLNKTKESAETVLSCQNVVCRPAEFDDANLHWKGNLDHLPKECLAMKKLMRRYSYEISVCEHL